MEDNITRIKLNAITDIALILVKDYGLSVTDAIRYITDTSILYSIDKYPEIGCSASPEFWAEQVYEHNKKLENLNIKYRRI